MDLSIIIPAYNVEEYLAECLDSLLTDSVKGLNDSFEIILVNDGSTDSTSKIAKKYAEKYNFILLHEKLNGGLSDARNVGVELSRGNYVSFIDSDDIIKSGFIEDILSVIKHNRTVDLISFDVVKFFRTPEFSSSKLNYVEVAIEFYCSKSLIACNKIYKKDLFSNIKFPLGKYFEDIWTVPLLMFNARRFIHVSNDYYGYRQRYGSITSSVDSKYMDILGALKSIECESRSNFISNILVSQFFTLLLLSLRLHLKIASKNISLVFDFFCKVSNVTPYHNKLHEYFAYMLFKSFRRKSKYLFMIFKPAVVLHLYIKKFRGR